MRVRSQEIKDLPLEANSPLERVVRKVEIVQIPGLTLVVEYIFDYFKRKQACKPRSYANPKLCPPTDRPTALTGVKCRATIVAKKHS